MILTNYNESSRHYHSPVHLFEMFEYLDALLSAPLPPVLVFATFYHDVIYDATSKTNEEDSASEWRDFYEELKEEVLSLSSASSPSQPLFSPQEADRIADKVCLYIIETKRHSVADSPDRMLQFFVDADMAVLGKKWNAYKEYASSVREEYKHIDDENFFEGRASFLRKSLEAERIYASDEMHCAFEMRARDSTNREIRDLEKRLKLIKSNNNSN